jgi:peptidoglycan lytic transglycosylase
MRPRKILRGSRPLHLAAAALMLAIPASAVALTAGQADAQSAIQINLTPGHTHYGGRVTVFGSVPAGAAGQALQLEFEPQGSARWQGLRTTTVRAGGRFRFSTEARRSGLYRVVPATARATPRVASAGAPVGAAGTAAPAPIGGAAIAPSAAAPVSVRARFVVRSRALDVLTGQPVHVAGKLLPGVAGRRVRLLAHSGRHWVTLATARTGGRGGFDVRYSGASTGQHRLRVRFAGDRLNGASWAHAGQLTVFRESVASWYTDGGGTGCGFHAHYGVANRTLPCGTKVTFRSGGRTVTATVDDRGPFVGGREWDLNQNVAGALGFGGVGTVWSSI